MEAPLAAPVDKVFWNSSAIQTGATWIKKTHKELSLVASNRDNVMENTEIKHWCNDKLCDCGVFRFVLSVQFIIKLLQNVGFFFVQI